jgi:hypothetical protein
VLAIPGTSAGDCAALLVDRATDDVLNGCAEHMLHAVSSMTNQDDHHHLAHAQIESCGELM